MQVPKKLKSGVPTGTALKIAREFLDFYSDWLFQLVDKEHEKNKQEKISQDLDKNYSAGDINMTPKIEKLYCIITIINKALETIPKTLQELKPRNLLNGEKDG